MKNGYQNVYLIEIIGILLSLLKDMAEVFQASLLNISFFSHENLFSFCFPA